MPHGKRVFQELDNWRLGGEFVRAVRAFDVVRHFFTRDQGPEPEVGRSRVLDELSKCPNVLKGAAWDVEAGGSEVEFIFRHGFSGFHHQFLIGADFAVHHTSDGGRRLLRLLCLRGRSSALRSSRLATLGLSQRADGKCEYCKQAEDSDVFHE